MSTEDLTALLEEADATADPSVPADRLANGGALIQRLARALKESKAEAATLRAERDRLTAERDRLRVRRTICARRRPTGTKAPATCGA